MADDENVDETRPVNDAYTGMLAISLAGMVIGSAFLLLDWLQYPSRNPPDVSKSIPVMKK